MGKVHNPKTRSGPRWDYRGFRQINGEHPYREAVADGFVDYKARRRPGGQVCYFNFDLAREMGLLPRSHPDTLYKDLAAAILDCFSIQIINEYDIENKTAIPKAQRLPNRYMATRYLQLQHPSRKGYTSGDGRSIWNGYFEGKRGGWDISSCGTGATKLSPAAAITKRFYRTGDKNASYGDGRSDLWDGVSAALMSDILHRNGIRTERTLAVIAYSDGTSVNVRAYRNLLRPAHFFYHMKQGNYHRLRAAVDYYIDRQIRNGDLPNFRRPRDRYRSLLDAVVEDFARATAVFECEYIFCWLDWDGDNILTDSAIIDYGSLRQFGLFHHEYRYDDVERMSTTISEQKSKAKYIVQTFIQIIDFLNNGRKRNIKLFRHHALLKKFDAIFEATKDQVILYKFGFPADICDSLLGDDAAGQILRRFRQVFRYFEKTKSSEGRYETEDGITWDAVFCVRDIMRELPAFLRRTWGKMPAEEFVGIMRSAYANDNDVRCYPSRKKKIAEFQSSYRSLVDRAVLLSGWDRDRILAEMEQRCALINRYERVTGDSILHVASEMIKIYRTAGPKELHEIFSGFVAKQVLVPENIGPTRTAGMKRLNRTHRHLQHIVQEYREGL